MRLRRILVCLFGVILQATLVTQLACGENSKGGSGNHQKPPPGSSNYSLLAWSELGMHCMDGKDYSIFAVLPPYNTIKAQLILKGSQPQYITSGVTITYEAVADANRSINTYSAGKTNFWTYSGALFLKSLALDEGLTGNYVQSKTPHPMTFDPNEGAWVAEAVPTVPYDDRLKFNPFPMARLVARDSSGTVLATADIVLAVSDEMSCGTCHASNSDQAAKPAAGWVNNPDPAKDVKLNILRLHDEKNDISAYLGPLAAKGYNYKSKLYDTAVYGVPILCASCHSSNALPGTGVVGVEPLTQAMHTHHAPVVNPGTGQTLDSATSPFGACYLCHPGPVTKCQRGAMNATSCQDCHGNLSRLGSSTRRGWFDEPTCQMCHQNSQRYATTFDSTNQWRAASDTTFATNPNTPITGSALFRFSKGHGDLYCSACHGSPHSEFPSLQANDNVYSIALQGYAAKITECTVCHTTVPTTASGGPHHMHTIGQAWVSSHGNYAESSGSGQCAYCHGADYRGSFLSVTKIARTFSTEHGTITLSAGQAVSCYDCHNGPGGGGD